MKKELVIIGAGNVGAFLAYNLGLFQGDYHLLGFLDDDENKHGTTIAGFPVLGNIETIPQFSADVSVAVGIAKPLTRQAIVNKIKELPLEFPNFISRNAWLSNNVRLGKGLIIYPGVSINYESVLGDFVIMNMNCAIGHNATIGDFCTLAPGVKFAGFATLNECVDVGIGAATRQNIRIGRNSVIGGQAMVIRDVPDNAVVVGNPGRIIRQNQNPVI